MRQKRIAGIVLWFLAAIAPAVAQEPTIEYGQASELRGVTKVFVDTGVAAWQREMIVKVIHKDLPELEVVTRPEESDIHFRFSLKETRGGNTEGVGTIVKLVGRNRERVLFSIKDYLSPIAKQKAYTSFWPIAERGAHASFGVEHVLPRIFAKEFVKAYLKANS